MNHGEGSRRIAVTGATGFVGRHVVHRLEAAGHDVVSLSRRTGTDLAAPDPAALRETLVGRDAVVHCAGINREIGTQTYDAIHVRGTQALVEAARASGVEHISVLSFLRARPDGPTAYHRSKWAAEAIVRDSGIPHTVLKAGVIHSRGDHMLDHLSHALHSFPVFGLVGMHDRPVRPVAVDDVARILEAAAIGDPRLRVPLVSTAQVHILAEGVVEAAPPAPEPPTDLLPRTPFSAEVIRRGLPGPGAFGLRDLRCCRA